MLLLFVSSSYLTGRVELPELRGFVVRFLKQQTNMVALPRRIIKVGFVAHVVSIRTTEFARMLARY